MKAVLAFCISVPLLAGCVSAEPVSLLTPFPASTVSATALSALPTESFPQTEYVPSPTATEFPYHGNLQFPFLNADAGNFQLETGATITFIWTDPPAEAELYEFVIYPLDGSQPITIGTDTDSSDGVSVEWMVPPDIAAELRAIASYTDGRPAQTTFSPTIYSPPSP